jgi:hypothetical protein
MLTRKSIVAAYFFWLIGFHYLYFGRPLVCILYILTGGGVLVWMFIDFFRIPLMVDQFNYIPIRDQDGPRIE